MSIRSVLKALQLVRVNLDVLDQFIDLDGKVKGAKSRVDLVDQISGAIAQLSEPKKSKATKGKSSAR